MLQSKQTWVLWGLEGQMIQKHQRQKGDPATVRVAPDSALVHAPEPCVLEVWRR